MVGKGHTGEDSFDRYLKEIRKFDVLTLEQELAIGKRMQEDPEYREIGSHKLVCANLPFVVSVSKKYAYYVPLRDIVQAGNMGLVKASYKYDYTKGFKFISYGVWQMKQEIFAELAMMAGVARVPITHAADVATINKVIEKYLLLGHGDREATDMAIDELARGEQSDLEKKVRANPNKVRETLRKVKSIRHPRSFQMPLGYNTTTTLADVLADKEAETDAEVNKGANIDHANILLGLCTEREAKILLLYYGEDLSLEEIGNRFGLTRERIRQIKNRALQRLEGHVPQVSQLFNHRESEKKSGQQYMKKDDTEAA